jgi:hypothetical protein
MAEGHLPLRALGETPGLDSRARVALLLVSLVDVDSRFGTLFAEIQAPLPYRRPTLETVGHMLAEDGWVDGLNAWSICQPLLHAGCVEIANPDAPRSEWLLRVPAVLWDLVSGQSSAPTVPWCTLHPSAALPTIDSLVCTEPFRQRLAQAPDLIRDGRVKGLIVRGMQGSERLEVLGALARELGLGVAEITWPTPGQPGEPEQAGPPRHWPAVGPLCTMARCLPVLTFDLGPGETVELPALTGYDGPVGIILGLEGGVRGPLAEHALTLEVPMPGPAERQDLWRQALGDTPADDLGALAERFALSGGYIRQAGGLAIAHAALEGRSSVTVADGRAACRSLNRQLLDALATRIDVEGDWRDLIVNEAAATTLVGLEQRCRNRERLLDHLAPAFRASANRGVRALFSGSSGTGKTLAVKILAAVLGMDLYRVDLSAVVNKYIGETEKNLHRVLSRAEELDVLLLLDEGDSLLGARTDVKSSNDRYANLETNYLLQRLEGYQGIVVVTTNASQLIDQAFQRRIDVVVTFVPPGALERWSIWRLHLPADHAVSDSFLEDVSRRCSMTGGQIRNAALGATLLALADGQPLQSTHLRGAIETEYRKTGALCPLGDGGRARELHGGIEAFMSALSHHR